MQRWKIFLFLATLAVHNTAPTETETERILQKRDQQATGPAAGGCPDLGTPSNGHRQCSQEGDCCGIGARVSYGCNPGYLLQGSSELTCTYDLQASRASWSGELPQCTGEERADYPSYRCIFMMTHEIYRSSRQSTTLL